MQSVTPTWTLGDRLRKALQHAELTPEQMAEQLGVAPTSVRGWMADRHTPNKATVTLWATITSVPLEWLADDTFNRPPALRGRHARRPKTESAQGDRTSPWISDSPAQTFAFEVAA